MKSRNYILFNKVLIHFDKILGKIVVVEPEGTNWALEVHLRMLFFINHCDFMFWGIKKTALEKHFCSL